MLNFCAPLTKGDWASVMAVSVIKMLPQAIIFGS